MIRLACLVLALCAATTPAAAAADCASDEENLLAGSNCSFDRDVAGWQAAAGDAAAGHGGEQGHPRPGALRADGGPNGSITVHGPCIAASPGSYEIGGSFRTASGTPYYCGVDVYQYSDASCELETGPVASAGRPPGEEWQTATATGVTDGDARSLRVRVGCSGKPGFAVLFDELVLVRR